LHADRITTGSSLKQICLADDCGDGINNGTRVNTTRTISNSPPSTPTSLSLTPPSAIGDVLSSAASGSSDLDGASVTYTYEFYNVNDASIVQSYSTMSSYPTQNSDAGDVLRVRARATDGDDNSDVIEDTRTMPALSDSTPGGGGGGGGSATVAGNTSGSLAALSVAGDAVVQEGARDWVLWTVLAISVLLLLFFAAGDKQ
jgi:hypothetical protein